MKVGDLVTLSSYGLARAYNMRIVNEDPSQAGIVIEVRQNSAYPYKVQWIKFPYRASWQVGHMRKELKYVARK